MPIRAGFQSNIFSYKDYSSAQIKNNYKTVISTQTCMVRSMTGETTARCGLCVYLMTAGKVFPYAHILSPVCVCVTCGQMMEMEPQGRGLACLCNDNRLTYQKEVLTSLEVIFKDSNVTTFLLVDRKAFHSQGRRKNR